MLTQPPESPRRDDDGQLYTQPPEETGEPPQRARFAFALVPGRNVADVFCPQMADLALMGRMRMTLDLRGTSELMARPGMHEGLANAL